MCRAIERKTPRRDGRRAPAWRRRGGASKDPLTDEVTVIGESCSKRGDGCGQTGENAGPVSHNAEKALSRETCGAGSRASTDALDQSSAQRKTASLKDPPFKPQRYKAPGGKTGKVHLAPS